MSGRTTASGFVLLWDEMGKQRDVGCIAVALETQQVGVDRLWLQFRRSDDELLSQLHCLLELCVPSETTDWANDRFLRKRFFAAILQSKSENEKKQKLITENKRLSQCNYFYYMQGTFQISQRTTACRCKMLRI